MISKHNFKIVLQNNWLLVAVLIVFTICKLPHLSYPYYWDESWPYAPAIEAMYKHGPSLLPNALDPELSRGHPLLFHAAAACWMNIFGTTHIALHSFALCISLLTIIAVYLVGLRLFNKRVAILALLLTVLQIAFFVQSSFVLGEVLVACLALLSLYFYVADRLLLTGVCLTLLFFTKESGLVMGAVLGLSALISLFNTNEPLRIRAQRIISVTIPVILIALFFCLQKYQRGWYLFPYHMDTLRLTWQDFWDSFRRGGLRVVFQGNLKYVYSIAVLVLAIIASIKNRSLRYLAILLPATVIFYFVDDHRAIHPLPSRQFFAVLLVSVACFIYSYGSAYFKAFRQKRFFILSLLYVLGFLCFSAVNPFSVRYFLSALLIMLFITAVLFDLLITHTHHLLFAPVVAIIAIIGIISFRSEHFYSDTELGAFDGMDVQQDAVNYLEQVNAYDIHICTGSFLEYESLIEPAAGFLHSGRRFTNVSMSMDTATRYMLFANLEPDSRIDMVRKDSAFALAYRIARGRVWAEIYKRK